MSRNLKFRNELFRPYAQAIGEMTLAWNDFHMVLSTLFETATKIPNKMAPMAIWNSSKSDRAQRDMLESLINLRVINYDLRPEMRQELKWVLTEATKLEELRNNAVHAPLLEESNGKVIAWHQLGNRRAKGLAGKELLKEFNWFYDTILVLREYAAVLERIMWNANESLPPRPKLPNKSTRK